MKKFFSLFIASLLCAICLSQNLSAQRGFKGRSVIIIGFDGLSSKSLNDGAEMPTLRRLIAEGSSSMAVRSVLPSSSAVNWASIFMGSGPELHGYTTWGSKTPDLPSREYTSNGIFPDIYWSVKQRNAEAKTACVYEWSGIRYLVDTLSIDHIRQFPLSDKGLDSGVQSTIDYIVEERPNLCSIIFDEPDGVGHKYGWESPEYFSCLTYLDSVLKQIVDAIEQSAMIDKTMIVVVSDHGGIDKGHGGKTMQEMQVPIVYYGDKVKKGHVIEESVMIYDVTTTIGMYLNIDQPKVWISRPTLSIFK